MEPAATLVEVELGDPRWDRLVARHPRASAYHLMAWAQVLAGAYGYRPRYLALAGPGGELSAGLPLVETRGVLGGRWLRGLPVVPPAGPLAESAGPLTRLLEAACEMAESSGAAALTVLAREGGLDSVEPRLAARPKTPAFVLPLPDDPERLRGDWRARSKNLHRSIERAQAAPLTVREGRSPADLGAFYRLYLRAMRRHNVLPRPLRQMALARDHLPDGVFRLVLVESGGRPVAGAILHDFRDTVDLLYNASDRRYLGLRPNHALYWHEIRRAIDSGRAAFDFGRARVGSSLAHFKSQWGALPVPEYRYEMALGGGTRRRDAVDRLAVAHGRPPLVARAWRRSPLAATRMAGELAYRWL